MELFKIKDKIYKKEDFLDDINEFEDIIPIIQEFQNELTYEEIQCVGENDCCHKGNGNYFTEIQGYINEEDEFITRSEKNNEKEEILEPFIIRIYMCTNCGKWIIDILE